MRRRNVALACKRTPAAGVSSTRCRLPARVHRYRETRLEVDAGYVGLHEQVPELLRLAAKVGAPIRLVGQLEVQQKLMPARYG